MKKNDYLKIRSKINFKKQPKQLFYFLVIELFLIFSVLLICRTSLFFLASPILCLSMFRNFSLMHDASHRSISNNSWLNNFIGVWAGCISLLPFRSWQNSHLKHHLWSGNIKYDPVMALRIVLPRQKKLIQILLNICWRLWIPVIAVLQYIVFWRLSLRHLFNIKSNMLLLESILPIIFWAVVIYFSPFNFILELFLPAFYFYFLLTELINLPHHLQIPFINDEHRFPNWEQYKTARSCIYPKWLSSFLFLNFNLHSEHHMMPDAPWYYLSDIHEIIKVELGAALYIDNKISWSIKNRRINLIEVISYEAIKNKKAS